MSHAGSALIASATDAAPPLPKSIQVQLRPRLDEVSRSYRDVHVDPRDGSLRIEWWSQRQQQGVLLASATDDGPHPRFELRYGRDSVIVKWDGELARELQLLGQTSRVVAHGTSNEVVAFLERIGIDTRGLLAGARYGRLHRQAQPHAGSADTH
jgi:hypothetical protein